MKDHIDRNLIIENTSFDENMKVYDVAKAPFALFGNSKTAKNIFSRMDEDSSEKISYAVSNRGARCAGVRLRFKTDSKRIGLKASLFVSFHAPTLNTISALGFDIYAGDKFIKSIFPQYPEVKQENTYEQVVDIESGLKDVTIYFPYNAVIKDLCIALDKESIVIQADEYRDIPPIVFYGSSITHGFCVSRPGIAFTAKISRKLNVDYINLGFSGAARGEDAMAEYLAHLNKSVLVCEYDHNEPSCEELKQKHLPFYKKIRDIDTETPILFISRPDEGNLKDAQARRKVIENTCKYARESGDRNVHFIDGLTLFPDAFRYDCTVDTLHPNDLGAHMIAEKLTAKLKEILDI